MAKTEKQKYVIKDPDAPMSKGQTYALYSMTGVDVRALDLTKGKASVLIDACNNGKCKDVRLALSELDGAEVKTRDVHKNMRGEKNPKGYKPTPAPKKTTAKAKKAAPESDEDNQVGLTMEAMQKLATEDPAQLIALLSGKPLSKQGPKTKTQSKKTAKKDETQNVSGDVAEELASLLAG